MNGAMNKILVSIFGTHNNNIALSVMAAMNRRSTHKYQWRHVATILTSRGGIWRHFETGNRPNKLFIGDGGHCGTVNSNGCQELPLIPPVWITSTNRHAHLPLDVGKVKESDWILERSRNQVGVSIGWGYSNRGDKWQFLAAIIVHRTAVTTITKYDHFHRVICLFTVRVTGR